MNRSKFLLITAVSVPLFIAAFVWFSALSFVPVPWPDDAAFYFAARELFKWPPRWVMLPQAPFEPTYAIFSFNIMPLFSVLIGLGKFIGLDGSFLIKFWSLLFWALSAVALSVALLKKRAPLWLALLPSLLLMCDPIARWGAVIVRPESMIGFLGTLLVLELTFGFPKKARLRGLFDPISVILGIAAYFHYNAIHLVIPVVLSFLLREELKTALKRLVAIGLKTGVYLIPYLLTVAYQWEIFKTQMSVQFRRLSASNDWLKDPSHAIQSIMQAMGSPEPWEDRVSWAGAALMLTILSALAFGILLPLARKLMLKHNSSDKISLVPAAAWVLGASLLWDQKPEVWFVYYIHVSIAIFVGVALYKLWAEENRTLAWGASGVVAVLVIYFAQLDYAQAARMGGTQSWNWETYHEFVSCVDQRLMEFEKSENKLDRDFHVWCPVFPDITIELARRHPDWILTRTNDFWERANLAVQHGRDVDAVVVTETLNWPERYISAPQSSNPEIQSTWMTWKTYFLNRLYEEPGWKPNRYLCQRGRWQAFMFMK